ncbi:MAG: radical SAM protein, partial [Nitrospiraceae bacterium]
AIMHGSRACTGPFQASMELTKQCSIHCIHCFFYSPYVERPNFFALRRARQLSEELPDVHELRKLQTLDADSDVTKNIIDTLTKMGTRKFFFSGSGEPFLHKDILDFIGRTKHAGGACVVYTNGTLLDRCKIDNLISLQCNELKITTLAGSRDVYLTTHPGIQHDAFDNLRDNLMYLAEQKTRAGARFPELSLHYVVIPHNCDDIENFVEFASQVRARRVLFRPVDTAGDAGLEEGITLTDDQARSVKKRLEEMKTCLDSRKIENNLPHFLMAFRGKMDTTELYRAIPCYYGWLGVRVGVDGHVYTCCKCYEPIGNIHEEDFRSIWHGSGYRAFRREALRINKGGKRMDGCECGNCTHFTANLLVFNKLHPVKSRSLILNDLPSSATE